MHNGPHAVHHVTKHNGAEQHSKNGGKTEIGRVGRNVAVPDGEHRLHRPINAKNVLFQPVFVNKLGVRDLKASDFIQNDQVIDASNIMRDQGHEKNQFQEFKQAGHLGIDVEVLSELLEGLLDAHGAYQT